METYLRSIPVPYPPKPACLSQIGNYPHPGPVPPAAATLMAIWVMGWLFLLTITLTLPLLSERDMVADMLRRLSRQTPPSVQPVYTVSGRGPFQGYYSPCSGRHYCLRGMDYYIDGAAAIRRHLNAIGERAVRLRCDGMVWDGLLWVGMGCHGLGLK